MAPDTREYVLPSTNTESQRLRVQGTRLYGGLPIFDPFLEDLPGRILDVGCGTGLFARHAAEKLPDSKVVGVDPDQGRLEFARGQGALPNLRFVQGSLPGLPFGDDAFDLVFSRFVLVHAKEPDGSLCDMARVTAPGGRVVAYDMVHDGIWFSPRRPALEGVLEVLLRVMRERGMEPSQGLHLGPAMTRTGLEDVRVDVIPHHFQACEPGFQDHRKNWIDTLAGLDEMLGEHFDPDLVERAMDELRDNRPDQFLLELTILASGLKSKRG